MSRFIFFYKYPETRGPKGEKTRDACTIYTAKEKGNILRTAIIKRGNFVGWMLLFFQRGLHLQVRVLRKLPRSRTSGSERSLDTVRGMRACTSLGIEYCAGDAEICNKASYTARIPGRYARFSHLYFSGITNMDEVSCGFVVCRRKGAIAPISLSISLTICVSNLLISNYLISIMQKKRGMRGARFLRRSGKQSAAGVNKRRAEISFGSRSEGRLSFPADRAIFSVRTTGRASPRGNSEARAPEKRNLTRIAYGSIHNEIEFTLPTFKLSYAIQPRRLRDEA